LKDKQYKNISFQQYILGSINKSISNTINASNEI